MKKIISALLATLMLLFTMSVSVLAAPKTGDIDGDGKINSADALLTLQHSVGSIKLDGDKAIRADVNADGKINSADALVILKIAVGSYTGNIGNNNSSAYDKLVNYIIKNGNYDVSSKTYNINYYDGDIFTFIIYDPAEKNLYFTQEIYMDSQAYPSYTYLFFEPGAEKQFVVHKVRLSSGNEYSGRGYIYTSSFAHSNKSIYNFECSSGAMRESMKTTMEASMPLLFFGLTDLLNSTDLDISVQDLGFTSWEY